MEHYDIKIIKETKTELIVYSVEQPNKKFTLPIEEWDELEKEYLNNGTIRILISEEQTKEMELITERMEFILKHPAFPSLLIARNKITMPELFNIFIVGDFFRKHQEKFNGASIFDLRNDLDCIMEYLQTSIEEK